MTPQISRCEVDRELLRVRVRSTGGGVTEDAMALVAASSDAKIISSSSRRSRHETLLSALVAVHPGPRELGKAPRLFFVPDSTGQGVSRRNTWKNLELPPACVGSPRVTYSVLKATFMVGKQSGTCVLRGTSSATCASSAGESCAAQQPIARCGRRSRSRPCARQNQLLGPCKFSSVVWDTL